MPDILPDETGSAGKPRIARHEGCSEAPVQGSPEKTAGPESRLKIGSELKIFGSHLEGAELDIKRDPTPVEVASYE